MSDKPFMTGPRDTGPVNLPPWPQLVIAGMGVLLGVISCVIGVNYEWIGDVYVRGPCAFLTGIGLMFVMGLVGDGFDKARAEAGEDS
jgi:hypothetical protein